MSKNKYLIIIILLGMITLLSAQVDTAWTRRWTSTPATGSDYVYGLAVDGSGNVYITGSSDYLGSNAEALTIKYGPAGESLWTNVLPRSASQMTRSVAVGASGNVYITGYTMETGNGNYFTVKYRANGDTAWVRIYDHGVGGYDFARKLVLDAQENVYITGYAQTPSPRKNVYVTVKYDSAGTQLWARQDSFSGAYSIGYPTDLGIDNSGNPYIVSKVKTTTEGDNYVVAKYNPSNGDTFWARTYNGPASGTDEARAIAFDASGNVYVTGISAGSGTGSDIATIKYNSSGDTQWVRRYSNPETTATDAGYWIKVDGSGNVYVYGSSSGTLGAGVDLVLIKYDASGTEQWVARYNGPGGTHVDAVVDKDGQKGMALDQSGNIYILGYTRQLTGQSTENDFITIKFNPAGDTQWTARYDYADSFETPYAIDVDNSNNVYVAGRSVSQTSYYDCVTIKYAQGHPSDYVITATAYGPGTITPSGAVIVPAGHDTTFAIAPNPGNRIDSVVVDNANQGVITNYTFYNVSATHTIKAYFSPNAYTITATAYGPGTITPSGSVVVPAGSDTSFAIAPNPGNITDSVVVDGLNIGTPSNYTFYSVMANHNITAYFSGVMVPITATADSGGVIIPSGVINVPYGGNQSFTIMPDSGYQIADVLVDDESFGAISYYEFLNVIEPHTIHAVFAPSGLFIIATASPNGTITPSGVISVNFGDDTTFTMTPDVDCQIDSVLVDGVSVGAVPTYTFYDISESHTIHALFSSSVVPGWNPNDSFPTQTNGRNIKDGGSLLAVPEIPGTEVSGYLYAFKGNKSNEFYRYTLNTGVWQQVESIPFGKKWPDTTKINKKQVSKGSALLYDNGTTIYALKGKGTFEFWAYDIVSNTWAPKAFVPSVKGLKGGTSMTLKDGKIYLLAGGQKVTNPNFFVYDPLTDVWTTLNFAPTAFDNKPFKDGSCITMLNDIIYALKGGGKHNYFSRYSGEPAIWSIAEAETIPLAYPTSMIERPKKKKVKDGGAMTNDGNEIYAIKGGGTQEFWKYTPGEPAGTWTALDTIPRLHKKSVIKTGAALTYLDDIIYILKGNNTLELWKYMIPEKSTAIKPVPSTQTPTMLNNTSLMSAMFDVTPNPFNHKTTIRYTVPISGKVSITLYNAIGTLIETIHDGYLNAGSYSTNLVSKNLTKGVYFLRYEDAKNHKEMKLIVE